MVRKETFLVIACTILIITALGGCGFFTSSYFPFYLSKSLAVADIEDIIPDLRGLSFEEYSVEMKYLKAASGGYLLMRVRFMPQLDGSTPEDRLVIFDESLTLQRVWKRSELSPLGFGKLLMSDVDGDFAVGFTDASETAEVVTISSLNGEKLSTYSPENGVDSGGYAYGGVNYQFSVDADTGSIVNCTQANPSWGDLAIGSSPTIRFGYSYSISDVVYDPSRPSGEEIAVVFRQGGGGFLVTFLSKGTSIFSSDLVTNYPWFFVPSYDSDFVFYTSKGLVTQGENNNLILNRFDGSTSESPSFEGESFTRGMYFEPSGNYMFTYDFDTRELYKSYTWWQP